jgi:hypothetical protein
MQLGRGQDLRAQIRGCVEQQPTIRHPHCDLGLRARHAASCTLAHAPAVRAPAIPLRKPTPGRGAEDLDARCRGYSSAAAYDVISQLRSISSKLGVVHSMRPLLSKLKLWCSFSARFASCQYSIGLAPALPAHSD